MPFVDVKVTGQALEAGQMVRLQQGMTSLMAGILHKVDSVVGVLVEEAASGSWSVGGEPALTAAHVEATISAGSNSPEDKAEFIAAAAKLLRDVLGPDLSPVSYVVLREVPKENWGYDGLTQAFRAEQRAAASRSPV